ncbi:MAG: ABC transporter permease [Chloroflexales bacterium]|nr:ABC transporter permease [Chloroflexales bacterium]
MATFLVRRLFQMSLVLLISTFVIFMILSLVPGGPLDSLRQNTDPRRRPSEADIKRMEKAMGIDKPWQLQYVTWMLGDTWLEKVGLPQYEGKRRGIIRGDLGVSWKVNSNKPVLEIIGARLPDTLRLMITATLLSILLAIPIGIYSAVHQYSPGDYIFTTISFIGISLPSFWFGLMLIAAMLALKRNGLFSLPTGDVVALRDYVVLGLGKIQAGSFLDRTLRLAMPVTVLTLINMAGYSRFLRSSMLEVLKQDYVRTARAKGVRERLVVLKHAMRNALIPLITIIVYTIPAIWGGALITESIFNYKGLGWLYIQALGQQDWPIVTAFLLVQAILVVFANMLADVLYTVADPRIRLS